MALCCARCGNRITSADARLEVMGAHEHTADNPAGCRYTVGCWAAAEGVEIRSNPSAEWSWFPGYRWQVEHCARCGQQLGWRFVRHDSQFHGFIAGKLVEVDGPAPMR